MPMCRMAVLAALAAVAAQGVEPLAFKPLPLGAVKPRGWLLRQLQTQANGLSGHLDEFWKDVGPTSGWLGGPGEHWERGPYFLDGLTPLAYLLDDQRLIAKVRKWVDWTVEHQRPDGGIGPANNRDWWPNFVMLKVLTQYQEAAGDPRIIPLMERYFRYQAAQLQSVPLEKWAVYRWADELASILWLYERNHDPKLLELARALHGQGYDWRKHFTFFEYPGKVARNKTSYATHVVNNAMALKTSALWWRVTGDPADRAAVARQLATLDAHHGLPNGVHSGDEHYAGLDPSQGTELCAVVEAMFSLEQMLAALGDSALGDRLEKIAYNPLPGTFTADMWAHQYDQQANQVMCNVYPRAWTNNGPNSNLFGLEPNYGCCTSNMHQGWPKLVAHLWMATPAGGLAAVAYGPGEVKTTAGGVAVTIIEETDYPFRGDVRMAVSPASPARFGLVLRIPAWAEGARVSVNGRAQSGVTAGAFYNVDRQWRKGDRVELSFPQRVRARLWYRDAIALERGPLVYSLRIGEQWRKLADHGPAADWEVLPTTPWNYAMLIDPKRPAAFVQVTEKPLGDQPFSSAGAPVELRVRGRRLPGWSIEQGSAGPLPQSPVTSSQPVEEIVLIPYGSAKLRITAFPWQRE